MRTSWIVWYAIVLHCFWGIELLTLGPIGDDYHGGVSWNIYITLGGPFFWGWFMLIGSTGSLATMYWRHTGVFTLFLLLPQQSVLTVGFLGNVGHIFGFGEEYALSRVLRVFPLSAGAFVFHTLAIISTHSRGIWKR